MKLIHVESLKLVDFSGQAIPRYVILSHRWGNDELSFKEFRKGVRTESDGYRKIRTFCSTVKRLFEDRIFYVWVDTVCIDKRSSAELTESINSMWMYYSRSDACFVYLNDVACTIYSSTECSKGPRNIKDQIREFMLSTWWTRGWTLQELLAPPHVIFFTDQWEIIGSKGAERIPGFDHDLYHVQDVCQWISAITKIPKQVLRFEVSLRRISVAQRMSWASDRETTREEDQAYCLLGLFHINMSLIYGEGRRAFERLQLEIIKNSHDQTIFGWINPSPVGSALFATSPSDFKYSRDVVRRTSDVAPYAMTNHGLEIRAEYKTLRWKPGKMFEKFKTYFVPMAFLPRGLASGQDIVGYIVLTPAKCGHYERILGDRFVWGPQLSGLEHGTLYVHSRRCEDMDNVPYGSQLDEIRFWRGDDGRRVMEKAKIFMTYKYRYHSTAFGHHSTLRASLTET